MYMGGEPATSSEEIGLEVHLIRGKRVMLDSDLARIYGVQTKRLKEQFKRNRNRFPDDFAFELTREEFGGLRSQFATSKNRGGSRYLPFAFTEHGAIMLAAILNSKRAVEMSVFVVRAFVRMRELAAGNRQITAKLDDLEQRVCKHDEALTALFAAIRQLLEPASAESRPEIGFHVREQAAKYRTRNRN
jgi:hypothetical protein